MTHKNDPLLELFRRMPEEELPTAFRENMMKQIMSEAKRMEKRNECWGWLAVAATSFLMLGIAIASFIYMDIQKISIQIPDLSMLPFYIYIGVLCLILLGLDYKFRQIYRRRQMSHKKET